MRACKPRVSSKIRCRTPSSPKTPRCPQQELGFRTIGAMVRDYIDSERLGSEEEIAAIKGLGSLERAVEIAALGQMSNGERSSHHYRRSQEELFTGKRHLMAAFPKLRKFENFDGLYNFVEAITDKIRGLGELYTYDAAHIIGAYRGFQPDKVYLHAGTRKGAKALGLRGGRYLEVSKLPREIQVLKAYEIEDFLCIYSTCLRQWAAARKAHSAHLCR